MSTRPNLEAMARRLYLSARLRFALIFVSLLIIAAIVVSAHTRVTSPAKSQSLAVTLKEAAAPVTTQGNSNQERVETELITITSTGFEPAEITRPKGRFVLEVDNRSGLSEINLRLDSEHGNRLHQKRVPREQLDWYQEVDLRPGHYLLTEADHPDWQCLIMITAP